MAGALHVNNDNFESEVLQASTPVLVDFYADWCGPCKTMAPVIDELADDYEGKVKVCKVNVDDNMEIASKYNVRSIPTLVIINNGEAEETLVGVTDKNTLKEKVDALIG